MVRRASMNSHDWIGAISNLEYNSGNLRASVGLDLRRYKGYHYRALNNLMGFDAYYSGGNRNNNGQIIETTIEAARSTTPASTVRKSTTTTWAT